MDRRSFMGSVAALPFIGKLAKIKPVKTVKKPDEWYSVESGETAVGSEPKVVLSVTAPENQDILIKDLSVMFKSSQSNIIRSSVDVSYRRGRCFIEEDIYTGKGSFYQYGGDETRIPKGETVEILISSDLPQLATVLALCKSVI